ncbi:alkaline phosphatase [Peptococcaceae bacterium]|nr:alkaline phosphatase [Peptococcaceae bacterium]
MIVTSDHDCGGLAVEWPIGEFPAKGEIPIKDSDYWGITPADLLYRDGVWTSGGHTAVDVPITATGPGAEMISGRMDNTDVFEVMRKAMSH